MIPIVIYFQCIKSTYLDHILSMINCAPPWMTVDPNLWCTKLLNLSTDKADKVDLFLSSLINDRSEKRSCLPSCKSIWYKTANTGFDSRSDRYGMFINIDREVVETRSQLNIGPLTLLTRIGGMIGVGKQFLWIIITVCSYLISLQKYSAECRNQIELQ